MTRLYGHEWIWTGGMLGILGIITACGSAPRRTDPSPVQTPTMTSDRPGVTRGMDVAPMPASTEPERPPRASSDAARDAPFVLDARLRGRRVQHGRSVTIDDVRTGDTVIDGDQLQLSVRTSRDGYLYLAFCSQHAKDPRYHGLAIFPETGTIRLIAHEITIAPGAAAAIAVDHKPGRETLYVIMSRSELPSADGDLSDAIAAARRGQRSDCGASFRQAVAGSHRKHPPHEVRFDGGSPPSEPASGSTGGVHRRPAAPSGAAPVVDILRTPGKPDAEIERGVKIESYEGSGSGVDADPDGIIVLRYELEHVAASDP